MALAGLTANKLRSFLTMLGVIVGVGSVIVMVALGEGARLANEQVIRKLGTNRLYIRPEEAQTRGVRMGAGTAENLELTDADELARQSDAIVAAVPEHSGRSARLKYRTRNTSTTVYGSTPEYFTLRSLDIADGRIFTDNENKNKMRVAVLGHETWMELFDGQSAVGKSIRINGQSFEVIGVQKKVGEMPFRNSDDQVTVPLLTAMRRLYGARYISSISAQAATESRMKEAEEDVYRIFRKLHRVRDGEPDDVKVYNQADLLDSANEQGQAMTILLSGVAMVSLLVGGIGIMNIMLVSVTERTREIGIRKALGARRKDILYQFLIESVTVSVAGGAIGIALAIGLAIWLGTPPSHGGLGMPMQMTTEPIAVAFVFSALVGIFFGIYPALKASALDPIEALRYE